MIISHKYRFIFIKTVKTAGTSIEAYLSTYCGSDDVVTPIYPVHPGHRPRNFRGSWNLLRDFRSRDFRGRRRELRDWLTMNKFYNHMSAERVRRRVAPEVWNEYFKFCAERNPWDKTLSHYHMVKDREGRELTLDAYLDRGNFCINYPLYTDERGNVIVDRVLRYENLNEELGEVFDRLKVPYGGSLGIRAKGDHRTDRSSYRDVFTAEQVEMLRAAFAAEIALHGYTF